MNGLNLSLVLIGTLIVVSWFWSKDNIDLVISASENKNLNGYYTAIGGIYVRRGYNMKVTPDVFDILNLRNYISSKSPTVSFSKNMWTINNGFQQSSLCTNEPTDPENYLYFPPSNGWKCGGTSSSLTIHDVQGSLQDSPPLNNDFQQTNIGKLLSSPVTTLLLLLIVYIAYYLWANRIEVTAISYSYDAVVNRSEYYRIVTATLSHVDMMHLGFNTMTLYAFGSNLEGSFCTSIVYLYDSINLIFFCIGIETLVLYLIIKQTGRTDFIQNQSIGYSGVLFAWMVAASVRMRQFCPIFFVPSFCFDTYFIPIPNILTSSGDMHIPINIGPFIALIVTKIIIPQSSFLGHLSGIIIGYPLAWNMLNWIIPPVMLSFLCVGYILKEGLYLNNIPNYSNHSNDLSEFVPINVLFHYHLFTYTAYILIVMECCSMYFYGIFAVLTRGVAVALLIMSAIVRKYEFMSSLTGVHELCVKLLFCTVALVSCLLFYDVATLTLTLSNRLLISSCGINWSTLQYCIVYMILLVITEMLLLCTIIKTLQDIPIAMDRLKYIRCDKVAIEKDLESLGITRLLRGNVSVFSGVGNRLTTTVGSVTRDSGSLTEMQPIAVSTTMHGTSTNNTSMSSINSQQSARGAYVNLNRQSNSPSIASSTNNGVGSGGTGSKGGRIVHL